MKYFKILLFLGTFGLSSCITSEHLSPPKENNKITVVVDFITIEGYFYSNAIPASEVANVVADHVCDNRKFYSFDVADISNGLTKFNAGCTIGQGESHKALTFKRHSNGRYEITETQGISF
ncbi:hypothetical protein [Hellea balneolensis]|uniref:hypothetical protein n=1 Tax=Hellea balneolensis TaxID=287478 RepID=UPI00047C1C55|nr:hypothetical protein [Hellea balneolensis]